MIPLFCVLIFFYFSPALSDSQYSKFFPITQKNNFTYLDNSATSQVPYAVLEELTKYYSHSNANVHRSSNALSHQATQLYEEARSSVLNFLEAKEGEIVFTSGTTESINIIANFWGPLLNGMLNDKSRAAFLVSPLDHHANILPWLNVCRRLNCELLYFPQSLSDISCATSANDWIPFFDEIKNKNIKIISFSLVSNVLGCVLNPINFMKIIKNYFPNALLSIDAAQAVSFYPMSVETLPVDFISFSAHKMYGPHGVGVLYASQRALSLLREAEFRDSTWGEISLRWGGGMGEDFWDASKTFFTANPLSSIFEAGTPNLSGVRGLVAAIHFIKNTVGPANVLFHSIKISHIMEIALRAQFPHFQILGSNTQFNALQQRGEENIYDANIRGPLVAFCSRDIHARDLAECLSSNFDVYVRDGIHCTTQLHQFLETSKIPCLGGSVRVSFAVFNSTRDVRKFLHGLHSCVSILTSP